ncbi:MULTISPECIES: hypothetical protein [Marinobacter]|uniref:hypothetical protein n=1 Tax=Marinobacter TaxID=2742 RepID=UPI000DAF0157|nr:MULTISPECIES: hypothetical protein [Marinobacter]
MMSVMIQRVIGLTEERQLEDLFAVRDLHISWRDDLSAQHQRDPDGRLHLAPMVTWTAHGEHYRFIPWLRFRIAFRTLPSILRQLGWRSEHYFAIDPDALLSDIGAQLNRHHRVSEREH